MRAERFRERVIELSGIKRSIDRWAAAAKGWPRCGLASTSMIALLLVFAGPVSAGPPLIADDPNTVGPGNAQVILFGSATGFESEDKIAAPGIDLTLGVMQGVDLTALVSPRFIVTSDGLEERSALIDLGIKLQPIRGPHWNAAFTPTVSIDSASAPESTLFLAIQLEYTNGPFVVGAEGGYSLNFNANDDGFAALYGAYTVHEKLSLLAEGWAGQRLNSRDLGVGFGAGCDWTLPRGLHLLVGGEAGFKIESTRTPAWRAYLGLQWNFRLWGKD
jgi:hypothetical protein